MALRFVVTTKDPIVYPTLKPHIRFEFDVQHFERNECYTLSRRYREFRALYVALDAEVDGVPFPDPPQDESTLIDSINCAYKLGTWLQELLLQISNIDVFPPLNAFLGPPMPMKSRDTIEIPVLADPPQVAQSFAEVAEAPRSLFTIIDEPAGPRSDVEADGEIVLPPIMEDPRYLSVLEHHAHSPISELISGKEYLRSRALSDKEMSALEAREEVLDLMEGFYDASTCQRAKDEENHRAMMKLLAKDRSRSAVAWAARKSEKRQLEYKSMRNFYPNETLEHIRKTDEAQIRLVLLKKQASTSLLAWSQTRRNELSEIQRQIDQFYPPETVKRILDSETQNELAMIQQRKSSKAAMHKGRGKVAHSAPEAQSRIFVPAIVKSPL